ncbi:MAG: DUF192 domain-containing protein [Phycisphaeraceae bacterium]|nr:DUF192 domain-containing protein [Phycisphaerales bacterium]MCB9859113.1 DUF192 domain-containing protein [Phycisphaeraceae bacterium]
MTRAAQSSSNIKIRIGLLLVALAAAIGAVMTLSNCQSGTVTTDKVTSVQIAGKRFTLELATNADTRFQGLSNRDFIADDGGMIFVFRSPSSQSFVMRHCPIDIDIMYLDSRGKILTMHEMTVEEPQREGESDAEYNARLKRYPSRFSNVQFVIELRGGRMAEIGVKVGDQVTLDTGKLKDLAS